MCNSRPAVLDLLLVLGELLVEDMALALDGEAEGLNEGREEADGDAHGDGDLCVAVEVGGHEASSEHGRPNGNCRRNIRPRPPTPPSPPLPFPDNHVCPSLARDATRTRQQPPPSRVLRAVPVMPREPHNNSLRESIYRQLFDDPYGPYLENEVLTDDCKDRGWTLLKLTNFMMECGGKCIGYVCVRPIIRHVSPAYYSA